MEYEEMRRMEKTHSCAQCDGELVTIWDMSIDNYNLVCGQDRSHHGYTRRLSQGELFQQGRVDEDLGPGYQEEQEAMVKRHADIISLIPTRDVASGDLIPKDRLSALIAWGDNLGLKPYLGHVCLYFGKPYVTIDGYYYQLRAKRHGIAIGTRPLKDEERQSMGLAEGDHAWLAEAWQNGEKLPTTGLFSAFSLRVECKRERDRDETALTEMLHEAITKIEMTSEGVKVLKSMRGRELLGLNLYDFGRPCEMQDAERAGGYNMVTFYLLAGRSLQDKKYMWNMSMFTDPELAVTNNLTSDDGEDWDVTSLKYQVFGWRWIGDPVPSPVGYLRADERLHYDTTGANVVKELTITRGHRIRRLQVMGWEAAHTLYDHIKRMEVEVNEGEYHPVTIDNILEYCWQNKRDYNLDIEVWRFPQMYDVVRLDVDACMCYPLSVQVTPYTVAAVTASRIETYNDGSLQVRCSAACDLQLVSNGVGYLTSLVIGFDKEPELEDMLETRDMSKLALELTEADADDTVSVVVEEEILY